MKLPSFLEFLDADRASAPLEDLRLEEHESKLSRWIPFIILHLACLPVFLVGISKEAVLLCIILYVVRMFAITGFYHRYFSHRSYKTSRPMQFFMGWLGATSCQRGPLWWASHHRVHHRYSDTAGDVHSPVVNSFIWSHIGWITSDKNIPTDYGRVKDFNKFSELRWLNRFDWLPSVTLGVSVYFLGAWLETLGYNVTGAQFLVWGMISTVLLFHGTCAINSVAHKFGSQRFDTNDDSRNNPLLALITLGEGWHNNHHRFPGSTRQGYTWWEIDITYIGLKALEKLGLVWDLTTPQSIQTTQSSAELQKASKSLANQARAKA